MAAEYTLYCFAQSGNAYKAALMLAVTGSSWAPRFVDYFGGETRAPAYRAINVMGEVPVLEHGSRRLAQSGVMLEYLAEKTGKFGASDGDERREILGWLLYDNHKLTSYTATYRFLRTFVTDPNATLLEEFRKRAEVAWSVLNAQLEGRAFVVANRPTIADLSLCGFIATASAAAAGGFALAQAPAGAAIVGTDIASLPPYGNGTLAPNVRSRAVANVNGMTVHILEASTEADFFLNIGPMAGGWACDQC